MQKRKYIKPEMEEVDLNNQELILCASGEEDEDYNGGYGSIIPTDINKQV